MSPSSPFTSIRSTLFAFALGGAMASGLWWLLQTAPLGSRDPGYAPAVARAAPSVVSIYSSRHSRPSFCEDEKYRSWCQSRLDSAAGRRESALGSGVILRADGYIVTNDHVIADSDDVRVGLPTGVVLPARIVGRDPETDLAILQIESTALHPMTVADPEGIDVGDIALAIGNPFGIGQTVSQGIVSAVGRVSPQASPWADFIQTDAAINPGNSGGALINDQGDLIGINSRIINRAEDAQGIGFAIPSPVVVRVLEDLIRDGRVRRGWLGLEVAEAAPANGKGHPGMRVTAVDSGGPAERAGLLAGDIILAVDDHMPQSAIDLGRLIALRQPESMIELSLERDGKIIRVRATVEEQPR